MAVVLVEGGDELPALVGRYNGTSDAGSPNGATPLAGGNEGRLYLLTATIVVISIILA
jgi:hypothetical protein